jgi:hypothetical protein
MTEPCGSFGCTLPAGHNRGRADIPMNHSVSNNCPVYVRYAKDVTREHLKGLGGCWICGQSLAMHSRDILLVAPSGMAYAVNPATMRTRRLT